MRGIRILALELALLWSGPLLAQSSVAELDRIIAIVNDDVIVLSELDRRIDQVRIQLADSGTPTPPYQVLQKQVLERLIMERLQLQVADLTGIRVSDDLLNAAINDMARANGLTLRQFREVLRQDNYDFAQFREEVRVQLIINQVRQRNVSDRIVVSDRDVDNFLSMQARLGAQDFEYRLSHILIATPEGASSSDIAAAREKVSQVLEHLRNGTDFAEVAVSESHGQQALSGGDLGWKRAAQLPTIFVNVVPDMTPGEISDIIKSPSGFHIIQLTEVRGHGQNIITQTLSRHILVRPNELVSDEDAEIRLLQLRARIESGEDFAELARAHSDDRASAIDGGKLGWLNPGDLIPQFERVADRMLPGEVSKPFKTQFGWHIVQVMERREYDNTEEVARAKARGQIRDRKAEEEGQTWLRQLRDSAYIEYRLQP